MFAIEVENLYKSYNQFAVLRDLNLQLPPGQVYGLLGPNGSGKSTLIHILLGFLKPNKGTVRVLGTSDLELVRSRIGYIPERLRYHLRYTGREYLRYLGQFNDLFGVRLEARIEAELRDVGLLGAADRRLNTYSKGMLQRLGIAQALLSDPEFLLIDEPTAGLDPAGQHELIDLLRDVRNRGHTIFLTTHFVDEIENLCDTVGVLFDGKIAAEADVNSLRTPGQSATISVGTLTPELVTQLQRLSPHVRCGMREVKLHPNSPELQARVLRVLLDTQTTILSLEPQGRALEEFYMQIVRNETNPSLLQEEPEETPPHQLFAPPGHPDSLPGALPADHHDETAPQGMRDDYNAGQPANGRQSTATPDQRHRTDTDG